MRLFAAVLCCAALLSAADTVTAFGHRWLVPIGADWKLAEEAGSPVLKLTVPRPSTAPRRPTQFALADTAPFKQVTVEADVKRTNGSSLILVYAYQDADHFNYAHLSSDQGSAVPYHNGIFHVYGGDRVRISATTGPGALPTGDWHHVKLEYAAETGRVKVFVDGKTSPALEAVDLSLSAGRVGLGSFFETADFKNVRIEGKP